MTSKKKIVLLAVGWKFHMNNKQVSTVFIFQKEPRARIFPHIVRKERNKRGGLDPLVNVFLANTALALQLSFSNRFLTILIDPHFLVNAGRSSVTCAKTHLKHKKVKELFLNGSESRHNSATITFLLLVVSSKRKIEKSSSVEKLSES